MFTKIDMDVDKWFLDTDIDISGLRLMTVLKAYQGAMKIQPGDPILVKAEQIASVLHWNDIRKVYKVAKRLEQKGFLKRTQEGRQTSYQITQKTPNYDAQFKGNVPCMEQYHGRHITCATDGTHTPIYNKQILTEGDMPTKKPTPIELLEAVQIPIDLQNLEGFPEALDDWLEYKQVEGPTSKAYKGKTGLKSFLTSALTEHRKGTDVVQAIHHAIGSGWQGVHYRDFQTKKSGASWARSKDETGFLDTVLDRRQNLKVLEGGR